MSLSGQKKLPHVGEIASRHDPDRFLMSMICPPERRTALWSLTAFNYEIAKTREVVSETTIGLIRLQWWRDMIESIYEGQAVQDHLILQGVQAAVQDYGLDQADFETLIHGREFDLEDVLPASIGGLRNYASFTTAPLNRMMLKILAQDEEDIVIEQVSQNYAMTGLLRSLALHAAQQRCYLPEELVQREDVNIHSIYAGKSLESLEPVVRVIANDVEVSMDKLSPQSRFMKMNHVMSRIYLKQIKSLKYDMFDQRIAMRPPLFLPLFLWGIR